MPARSTKLRKRKKREATDALASASSLLVHDMKNLTFRLGTLLENLQDNYDDPLFKKSVVEVLNDTMRQMEGMVRRCRERRDGVIIRYRIDLNEVLDRIISGIPEQNHQQEGPFIEVRYGRIPKIWGDPDFLGEAFAIMIQNGLEAMEENGGKLTLETRASTTRGGRKRVVIRITDQGCGMSPEFIRDRLFAPFVTTKAAGMGMGLYACRKIVDLHEGVIRVTSRPGRGTTFRVFFDAA